MQKLGNNARKAMMDCIAWLAHAIRTGRNFVLSGNNVSLT